MNLLWLGLLAAAALAATQPASTNRAARLGELSLRPADNRDAAAEKEFQLLMAQDDAALAEVDKWIRENDEFEAKGAGLPAGQLRQRILDRIEPVRKAYEDFIKRHPNHAGARVAYASFLSDTKDEESAQDQLEKALALDTNNPAIYNNLANIYGHIGPVRKAFAYYTKAIELNPLEPIYYHNFGTTVYLFRSDAKEYFHLDEAQVFAKAFALYSNAMRLDPENFPLASDVAQSYYGVQPIPIETALNAWTNALKIAHDEFEREGVQIHFARLKILAGRLKEAQAHLDAVTNAAYGELKSRLTKNLLRVTAGTNAPPTATPSTNTARPVAQQKQGG